MERGYAPSLRFFCRPELVVVDLVPEETMGGTEVAMEEQETAAIEKKVAPKV
jgi:hypothetical protein